MCCVCCRLLHCTIAWLLNIGAHVFQVSFVILISVYNIYFKYLWYLIPMCEQLETTIALFVVIYYLMLRHTHTHTHNQLQPYKKHWFFSKWFVIHINFRLHPLISLDLFFFLFSINYDQIEQNKTKKKVSDYFINCINRSIEYLCYFASSNLLIDVIHHFIVSAACIDFWNNSWCQTVHQFA